ncbi:DNA glycosylase [Diplogelasinospora grovesii]|uniref:Adenine DNA glycosylase n=1 Tax=Diplogelasinospora grovesii TaxID=303347 RepID=A0AAN6MY91_9PEZI|nr:DNA glycosylase [Diplogelasinospora grovesii]
MPWRKAWVDPSSYPSDGNLSEEEEEQLRSVLRKRAYEVWISEIMLQQTRVAVVIGYWERWMERWPTVDALAAAAEDDVRSAWQGLGYYSRATRIHEAAKLVCNDPVLRGLLPATAEELEKKVPGVGRYTAGAISAIVFGRAAAMVDGNVLRVLSRQLGILGDVKTDKKVIDTLWAAADALVKAVAWGNDERREEGEPPLSDRPGRWGQALMELGSTVCTPKPNCSACPVTDTCRAYAEGHALATEAGLVGSSKKQLPAAPDIEELCGLCEYFEDVVELDDEEDGTVTLADNPPAKPKPVKDTKQSKLSSFFFTPTTRSSKGGDEEVTPATKPSLEAMEVIASHARKFPVRKPKKKVREEETVVCAIRRESLLEPLEYEYIIHRRPEKGLLAGMWELPSHVLPESNDSTPKSRKSAAISYASGLVRGNDLKYVGKLGSVPWLFSHLKLTMHVYLFEIVGYQQGNWDGKDARWADTEKINLENMGTGMKKCWELVRRSRDSDYNSES